MQRRSWRTAMVAFGLLCLTGAAAAPVLAGPPEITERGQLRVCADGNNLPFSNRDGEGFENRIAELMAEELGVPVSYVWAPQIMGFVRNTLDLGVCDVIIGVAAGYELVQNTNAYYRSVYSLVVPEDADLDVTSLHDPALAELRIGAITDTPPVVPLRRTGASVKTYALQADTRVVSPVRDAVKDVADGVTQGAVLWGPIAGYYAGRQDPPLRVVPLVGDTPGAQLQFRITMGVRRGEPRWMDWINDFIDRRQTDIDAVLADYGVPLLDRHGQLITVDSPEHGD